MADNRTLPRHGSEKARHQADGIAGTGANVADETARAAVEISDRATELGRQSIETIQKGVESGLEMTSRMTERSMSFFSDTAGIPSGDAKEVTDHSFQNIRALVDSSSELMNTFQEATRDWFDRARERMKEDMDAYEAVLRSRTLTELTEAQTSLVRRQFEGLIFEGQKATDLVGKATTRALKKIKA